MIRHTFPVRLLLVPRPFRALITLISVVIPLSVVLCAETSFAADPPGPDQPNPLPSGTIEPPAAPAVEPAPPSPAPHSPPTEPVPALEPDLRPEAVPEAPLVPGPRPAEPPPLTTPPPLRTQWTPFDGEIARTADGSVEVCATAVLPLTIVPGVGDIIGTIADWFCIIPAAIAVDYTGAYHGNRSTQFWQPAVALILKKTWETLVDTPIFVGTVAVLAAAVAGGIAVRVYADIPATVLVGGAVAVTVGVYTGLKSARDSVGDLIFLGAYNLLVREGDEASSAGARDRSVVKPGMTGVPATWGLVATVAGSRAPFAWSSFVPVLGPVWKAEARAEDIELRTHRYIAEVLQVQKRDLSGMDATAHAFSAVQGWSMAAAHVGIGLGLGFAAAGVLVATNDVDNRHAQLAEQLGAAGLVAAAIAAGGAAVSYGAERLQPVVVPIAFAFAE